MTAVEREGSKTQETASRKQTGTNRKQESRSRKDTGNGTGRRKNKKRK